MAVFKAFSYICCTHCPWLCGWLYSTCFATAKFRHILPERFNLFLEPSTKSRPFAAIFRPAEREKIDFFDCFVFFSNLLLFCLTANSFLRVRSCQFSLFAFGVARCSYYFSIQSWCVYELKTNSVGNSYGSTYAPQDTVRTLLPGKLNRKNASGNKQVMWRWKMMKAVYS